MQDKWKRNYKRDDTSSYIGRFKIWFYLLFQKQFIHHRTYIVVSSILTLQHSLVSAGWSVSAYLANLVTGTLSLEYVSGSFAYVAPPEPIPNMISGLRRKASLTRLIIFYCGSQKTRHVARTFSLYSITKLLDSIKKSWETSRKTSKNWEKCLASPYPSSSITS